MQQIDLNCDLGEGFGNYTTSIDRELMQYITSCNVACGFHAGDPVIINNTIKLALSNNLKIGAHPSLPDKQGFGRRNMQLSTEEYYSFVLYQVAVIKGMTESNGGRLNHVKPHGALYNQSADELEMSLALYTAITDVDSNLIVYGLESTAHEEAAKRLQLNFVSEAFGDRAYKMDGKLVPRTKIGAVLEDSKEVIEHVLRIVEKREIKSIDGSIIKTNAKTICFHGDHSNSVNIVKLVNNELKSRNINIRSIQS
jgi:UPF0271 protein